MCRNPGVERSLLPECHIANRLAMYFILYSLLAEERRDEEVAEDLRDRYVVFRQVLNNFPEPLRIYILDTYDSPLAEQYLEGQQPHLFDVQSNTSMENNASESCASQSSIVSSSSSSPDLSAHCDYYDNALQRRLAQLGRAGVSGAGGEIAQPLRDCKEDEHLQDSGDETN